MTAQQFPLRIARGNAFCNRNKERAKLRSYINAGHHIWLQAHRRHGKTSLLLKTKEDFEANNEPLVMLRVDLAFKIDKDEIIKALCSGAIDLIGELLKSSQEANDTNLLQVITNFFQKQFLIFSPQIQFDRALPSVRFTAQPSLDMLQKTLTTLDEMAQKYQYRAVYVIDEFQQVGKSANTKKDTEDNALEGIIRHCLEQAENVNYVFSGSENTLMAQAMENENRPLYNHTLKLPIERITKDCYREHIGGLWLERWGNTMPDEPFHLIMTLTQNHPYYVNALCALVWIADEAPGIEAIVNAWEDIAEQDNSDFRATVLKLKKNEVLLLKALAKNPTREPTSLTFSKTINIPAGSIKSTLAQLIEKDLVYVNNDTYTVINPALAYVATKN